jgi:hypothetical protein
VPLQQGLNQGRPQVSLTFSRKLDIEIVLVLNGVRSAWGSAWGSPTNYPNAPTWQQNSQSSSNVGGGALGGRRDGSFGNSNPAPPSAQPAPFRSFGQNGGDARRRTLWQPRVATPFQIVISGVLDLSTVRNTPSGQSHSELTPGGVEIFDIDLWETSTATVDALHQKGKKVICYFSAGTSEDWRPDFRQFREADQGAKLPLWKGERWLDIRQKSVWTIMQKRIKLASQRGCDAIDPDNVGKFCQPYSIVNSLKTYNL